MASDVSIGAGPASGESLLEIVSEVIGLLELDEFRWGVLRALRGAVAVDWISLNDIGPTPDATLVLIEPEFPTAAHETYARYAHENPLLQRYQRTADGRAYRFSDVCTTRQLHDTSLYREFYGPIGLEHQIAFTLPHAPDRVLALALSRREHDFSDAERDLLSRARPFLIQSFRNAVEHSRACSELELRRRALHLPVARPGSDATGLTQREAEVLALVATGASDHVVARSIGVSERTVQKHLEHCYRKLGVHSREQAVGVIRSLADG